MDKKPNVNVVIPFGAFKHALVCDDCGRPAEVMGVYGECEVIQCASCYVREHLPKMSITFGKRADFDGAWVGTSYFIDSYDVPEDLQD